MSKQLNVRRYIGDITVLFTGIRPARGGGDILRGVCWPNRYPNLTWEFDDLFVMLGTHDVYELATRGLVSFLVGGRCQSVRMDDILPHPPVKQALINGAMVITQEPSGLPVAV